jgi:hypothetical protein
MYLKLDFSFLSLLLKVCQLFVSSVCCKLRNWKDVRWLLNRKPYINYSLNDFTLCYLWRCVRSHSPSLHVSIATVFFVLQRQVLVLAFRIMATVWVGDRNAEWSWSHISVSEILIKGELWIHKQDGTLYHLAVMVTLSIFRHFLI